MRTRSKRNKITYCEQCGAIIDKDSLSCLECGAMITNEISGEHKAEIIGNIIETVFDIIELFLD